MRTPAFRLALLLCLFANALSPETFAQGSPAEIKLALRRIQAAPSYADLLDSLSRRDISMDAAAIPVIRAALWEKYAYDVRSNAESVAAFERGEVAGSSGTMRFTMKRVGDAPAQGYPVFIALHGGGGGPSEMNDSQWEVMGRYYLKGIPCGLYVAPRGLTDTWDLHFTAASYLRYRQLITDLIIHAGADPNRIYLLGYSAGGDGVYQVSARMSSSFAAVSMSAGHPNGVSMVNMGNLPILLQVGALDDAYKRNTVTAEYGCKLDSLAKAFPGMYAHQAYVHYDAQHSYVKDNKGGGAFPVYKDNAAWLKSPANADTIHRNTDAPTWLAAFTRDPYPTLLRWDNNTQSPIPLSRHYWLSGHSPSKEGPLPCIEASYLPGKNKITVRGFQDRLFIHLHERIADPSLPLELEVNGQHIKFQPRPSALAMATALQACGDPQFGDYQTVYVWNQDGVIKAK